MCWDSFNIFQSQNLSSLTHEGNKVNEEVFPYQVEKHHEPRKYEIVQKSQREKFLHNPLSFHAGFDLRANPFEEGENDVIKSSLSMWKETYKKFVKKDGSDACKLLLPHVRNVG
jgi:hypothetical protein